jgi:Mn2+/Fe2+ NRAMP family transporter
MKEQRKHSPEPPKGKDRLKWYGPGLMWMISSVGSGSVLFTPRVGARYGFEFLWVALIIIFLMWIMIREVGRYSVVTGKTIFDGFKGVSGKSQWPIWLIFLPQVLAAVVTISGMAALTGSALMIAFPGNQQVYGTAVIILSIVLVISGRYKLVEKIASVMAGLLVAIVIVTCIRVFSSTQEFVQGLIPAIPEDLDMQFVMPWLGFILAGAAGIMWFSYWVVAREYGGPQLEEEDIEQKKSEEELKEDITRRLKRWLKIMSNTAAIGVIGGGLVIVSFLILGTELLKPEGIVPEGIDVAKDLSKLLSDVWGRAGFWMLIISITIALAGTILSNQDGWGRMFADATLILLEPKFKKEGLIEQDQQEKDNGQKNKVKEKSWWQKIITERAKLKDTYAIVFGAVIPLIVFYLVRNPVDILAIAGTVAAVHTPVVVFLTLYLNMKRLPEPLRPGAFSIACMVFSGVFFSAFAIYHFATL